MSARLKLKKLKKQMEFLDRYCRRIQAEARYEKARCYNLLQKNILKIVAYGDLYPADAFNAARQIYELQTRTLKNKLYRFYMYLRFDDTKGDIVKQWSLKYNCTNGDKFFDNQAHSFEALYLIQWPH